MEEEFFVENIITYIEKKMKS